MFPFSMVMEAPYEFNYTSDLTALKAQFHFYVGKRDILHRLACRGKPALEPEPADGHVIFVRRCPILTAFSSLSN